MLDRTVYLRNYVLGVLVCYSGVTINAKNMVSMASQITESVIIGDEHFQDKRLCEEITESCYYEEEDVPL